MRVKSRERPLLEQIEQEALSDSRTLDIGVGPERQVSSDLG